MDHPLITTCVLVGAFALALVAQWRGWWPSLTVALSVGIGLRLGLLVLAAADSWQPVDFTESFRPAAEAIMAGQDPVLSTDGAWHFLPMIPYAYALPMSLGIPWVVSGRLLTVAADVVLIVLVGRLAGGQDAGQDAGQGGGTGALRRFQYACNPIALMVAVIHAQVEPIALVFLVGAYLAAGSARPAPGRWDTGSVLAGALFGLALSAKSWPIIVLPVLLAMLPTWRQRLYGLVAAGAVPCLFLATQPLFVHSTFKSMLNVAGYLGGVRPIIGEWGWTAVLTGGDWDLHPAYSRIGQLVLYGTLAVVAWLWRRGDRVDLTLAMLLAFMVVTPRMGAQYLLWFTPFLVARPTRWGQAAIAAAALWAGLGYVYLTQFDATHWWAGHRWWAQSSVIVIPLLVAAMPWARRRGRPDGTPPPTSAKATPELVGVA
jgi:glycosyl transferase family 87